MCGSTRIEPGAAVRVRVPGPWTWFGCLFVCNCLFVCLFVCVRCELRMASCACARDVPELFDFQRSLIPVTSFCVSSLQIQLKILTGGHALEIALTYSASLMLLCQQINYVHVAS